MIQLKWNDSLAPLSLKNNTGTDFEAWIYNVFPDEAEFPGYGFSVFFYADRIPVGADPRPPQLPRVRGEKRDHQGHTSSFWPIPMEGPNAGSMLSQRQRRCLIIEPQLGRRPVLAGHSSCNLSKHKTLTQCCFDVGPPSTTLAQHQNNIGPMSCVCWDVVSDTGGGGVQCQRLSVRLSGRRGSARLCRCHRGSPTVLSDILWQKINKQMINRKTPVVHQINCIHVLKGRRSRAVIKSKMSELILC